MLNITIEDSLLESNLKQAFGEDTKSITKAFSEFIQGYKIKQDRGIDIALNKLNRLTPHPGVVVGDPDDIAEIDWSTEWRHDIS